MLTERVKTGASALKIGRKLGVTKGVVIGILWRAKHSPGNWRQSPSNCGRLRPRRSGLGLPVRSQPRRSASREAGCKAAHPKPKPPPLPRPPPAPPLPPVSAEPEAAHWQVVASAVMRPPEAVCVPDLRACCDDVEAATAAPAISAPVRLSRGAHGPS